MGNRLPGARRALALGPAPSLADGLIRLLTPARVDVFDQMIAVGTGCTIAELARRTGQHENTVRDHLDALVRAGLARRERAPARGRGRPAWVYTAQPEGALGERAKEYAALASAFAGWIARTSTNPKADAVAVGEHWGLELAQSLAQPADQSPAQPLAGEHQAAHDTDGRSQDPAPSWRGILEVFDRLGFAPDSSDLPVTVRLTRCPLLEVAHQYPEVVCWVHMGVARGVLQALGHDAAGLTVRPFAEPGACLLRLPPPA